MTATHVKPHDVLLNITGASIGRVCAVPGSFLEGNVNQHVCIIRPRRSRIEPRYLAAFISTPEIQTEIYIWQTGSSREGLTLHSIRDLLVLVPPLEEQQAIVKWAGDSTGEIDAAIAQTAQETVLLREYSTRLIADVVTGKLDVRDAAARLRDDDEEELDPFDELDVISGSEDDDYDDLDEPAEGIEP